MTQKKPKAVMDDSIEQLELPLLWPDHDGLLTLPPAQAAHLNALRLRHWPPSPRALVKAASRHLSSRSFAWWRWWKSLGEDGFIEVGAFRFETWLMDILQSEAFGAVGVNDVLDRAVEELRLDRWEAVRLLLRSTRPGASFKSDGGLVTVR